MNMYKQIFLIPILLINIQLIGKKKIIPTKKQQIKEQLKEINMLLPKKIKINKITNQIISDGLLEVKRINLKDKTLERIFPYIIKINYIKKIKSLSLPFNKLTLIPKPIKKLENLEELNIASNNFSILPKHICQLKKLKNLVVINNQLKGLPKNIGRLKKLEELHLNKNQLKNLPSAIGTMTNLEYLDLSENKLRNLPYAIGKLSNLEELYINFNNLKEIPKTIGNLSNLIILHVEKNPGPIFLPKRLKRKGLKITGKFKFEK